MINFGNNFIVVMMTWQDLKTILNQKQMSLQYVEETVRGVYELFVIDEIIVYRCIIYTGSVPAAFGSVGAAADPIPEELIVSQAQNDSDKVDFESNYKISANKPLDITLPLTGSNCALVGFNGAYMPTAATTLAAVRASVFVEQTNPCRRSFSSTSATDNLSGSGARQIRLTYYDNQMNGPYTEDLYLSGTSVVNTLNTNIQFVEQIRCTLVGANGGNAGNINMFATSSGGGGLIAQIPASDGKTYYAHHYVRANNVFSIKRLFSNTTNAAGNVSIRFVNPLVTGSFEDQIGTAFRVLPGGAGSQFDFDDSVHVIGPARVTVYAKPDSAIATTWYVNFAWEEY